MNKDDRSNFPISDVASAPGYSATEAGRWDFPGHSLVPPLSILSYDQCLAELGNKPERVFQRQDGSTLALKLEPNPCSGYATDLPGTSAHSKGGNTEFTAFGGDDHYITGNYTSPGNEVRVYGILAPQDGSVAVTEDFPQGFGEVPAKKLHRKHVKRAANSG